MQSNSTPGLVGESHQTTRPLRWSCYLLLLALFSAVSVTSILKARPLRSANDRSRWCTVWSLAERGTYRIDEIDADPRWRTIDKVRYQRPGDSEPHYYSTKPPLLPTLVTGVYLGGWALLLYATALIDHFDLFGLRQVWLHWKGETHRKSLFVTPSLYERVRHPLYVAWLVIFWAAPTMTVGHLLLAVGTTAYVCVAVLFEERDLVAALGAAYRDYQARTPRFFPRLFDRAPRGEQARSAG